MANENLYNSRLKGNNVTTMIPNDAKTWVYSKVQLQSIPSNSSVFFTFYDKMRVLCAAESEIWEWREAEENEEGGLMPSNFIYPSMPEINDVDYSNKEYNFFEIKNVTVSNLSEIVQLENIGTGQGVYKQFNPVSRKYELYSFFSNSLQISLDENRIVIDLPFVGVEGSIPDLIINQDYIPTYQDFINYYEDVYIPNGGTPLEEGDPFSYKGEGTAIKPFTDTRVFTFGEPNTAPTTIPYTSIANGIEYYIGTGTADVPQYGFRVLTVKQSVTFYTTSRTFNVNRLRLNIEDNTTINYVSEDDIIDMNNPSYFSATNSDIIITIGNSSSLVIETKAKIKNSGNTVATVTYATGRTCYIKGEGTLYFGYSGADAKDHECFSLDPNSNINGATGCNNDGHICIQIECNLRVDYRSIVKQGGNSKIEFKNNIISFNSLSGISPDIATRIFKLDGGLIRFFDCSLNIFNGNLGLGSSIERCFSFGKVGTFQPNLVMRNVQFTGFTQTWFYKENTGSYISADIKSCTSLYFSGVNLFGSVADTNKWLVDFRNNVLENINVDFDIVDFTLGNNISSFNTIGNNIIEQLVKYPYRRDGGSDTVGNLYLPKYSKFINMQGSMVESQWFVDVML